MKREFQTPPDFLGGFKLFERIMMVLVGTMFLIVMVTALCLWPDAQTFGAALTNVPSSFTTPGLGWTMALLGGVGGTVTILSYGYWIREEGREGIAALKGSRFDLFAGYFMTALFGMGMVIIGAEVAVEGKGTKLLLALSDRLGESLGEGFGLAFLVGAWGAVFSSWLGVLQAVPYLFSDVLRVARAPNAPGQPVGTRWKSYRAFQWGLAFLPLLGMGGGFAAIQKAYGIVGALFVPLLALVCLLLLGGRSEVPLAARNGWLSRALLTVALLFFVGAFGLILAKQFTGS